MRFDFDAAEGIAGKQITKQCKNARNAKERKKYVHTIIMIFKKLTFLLAFWAYKKKIIEYFNFCNQHCKKLHFHLENKKEKLNI